MTVAEALRARGFDQGTRTTTDGHSYKKTSAANLRKPAIASVGVIPEDGPKAGEGLLLFDRIYFLATLFCFAHRFR